MRSLYLFRHGETDWNIEQRFQGHIDIPLNATGRSQARTLVEPLRRLKIQAIISSDLSRARETAELIAGPLSIPVFDHIGLREAHLGQAQGLTVDEIRARFGEAMVARWKSPFLTDADAHYPGGETGREILSRTLQTLEEFLATHPYDRIGVATHGGVIRRVARHLLGEDSPPVPIPNGIVYPIRYHAGEWSLRPVTPLFGVAAAEPGHHEPNRHHQSSDQ